MQNGRRCPCLPDLLTSSLHLRMWNLLVFCCFFFSGYSQNPQQIYNYTDYPIEYGQIFRLVVNSSNFGLINNTFSIKFYGVETELCSLEYQVQIPKTRTYMARCLNESKLNPDPLLYGIQSISDVLPFYISYFFFTEGHFTVSNTFPTGFFRYIDLKFNLTEPITWFQLTIQPKLLVSFSRLEEMPDNWQCMSKQAEQFK